MTMGMSRVLKGRSNVLVGSCSVLMGSSRVLRSSSNVLTVIVRVLRGPSNVLVDAEFRRRYTRAQYLLRVDVCVAEGEAAQGGPQIVERQARIEERAERHV